MQKGLILFYGLLVTAPVYSAYPWAHAGRWGSFSGGGGSWSAHGWRGGYASGGGGSWSGHGWRGGSASGSGGSWSANGWRGGTASGGGGNWHATGAGGQTTYGGYHSYYGGYYGRYHPPTVINAYGVGCYNCGGWNAGGAAALGVVGGMALGSTLTAAAQANSANAYAEGVAAGTAAMMPSYGAIYASLPGGCFYSPYGGFTYYRCSSYWLSPAYGANGVYYRVVAAPY